MSRQDKHPRVFAIPRDEGFDEEKIKETLDEIGKAIRATSNPYETYEKLMKDHKLDKKAFMFGMLYASWIDFTLVFPALAQLLKRKKDNFISKRFRKYSGR